LETSDKAPRKFAKVKKPRKTAGNYRQGMFTPTDPHRYLGDATNIIFRSSWEQRAFKFLDTNPYIIGWASEPFGIDYMKPTIIKGKATVKRAKYFPDLYVEYIDKNGNERKELIEIKPDKQTRPSKARKATTKIQENYVYTVNMAKWQAAEAWCKKNGVTFRIATEKTLFK
jgi:hypothetical protein